jgi:hypothetical protein
LQFAAEALQHDFGRVANGAAPVLPFALLSWPSKSVEAKKTQRDRSD